MSCLSDKTKQKLIKKDLFQLRVREASAFGAFNSFVVLPILLISYAIYLNVSNIEISESEMVTTKECAPFNFTCTTKWGCEVAAMGTKTTALFTKGKNSLYLKYGQRMNESICPGLSEGLDIAPRAALKVDDRIYSSFEHGGFGYFGSANGNIYQVNLATMRLVNQSKLGDDYLATGFVDGGYGYFGGLSGMYKIDLKTLALVKSVGVDLLLTGFASNGYGYFGGYYGTVSKVNLNTMEVEHQKTISNHMLYASILFKGYGYFGGADKTIYQVNLTTLNVTSTPVDEVFLSVCCGQYWGTFSGKVLLFDTDQRKVLNTWNLGKGAIGTLTDGYAGTYSKPAHVVSYGGVDETGEDFTLTGVQGIRTGFSTDALYYGSDNGYIVKIEVEKQFPHAPIYPTMGEPIGMIHQTNPLDFPTQDDKSSTFSFFSTNTTFTNGRQTVEYLYQSTHVHTFKDHPCGTSQPDYLCRRINLGPIQMQVTKSLKYGTYLLLTMCFTTASAMFGMLGKLTLFATKMYPVLKRKCYKEKQGDDEAKVWAPNPLDSMGKDKGDVEIVKMDDVV